MKSRQSAVRFKCAPLRRKQGLIASALSILALLALLIFLFSGPGKDFYLSPSPISAGHIETGNQLSIKDHKIEFANRVQRLREPTLKGCVKLPVERLNEIREILRPNYQTDMSTLLHAIQIFGKDLAVNKDGQATNVLQIICDVKVARQFFPAGTIFVRTRYGIRTPEIQAHLLATPQAHSQSHKGQLIAILAGLGVPLSSSIEIGDGQNAHVQDLLNDLIASFQLSGEIFWEGQALCIYLPPNRS